MTPEKKDWFDRLCKYNDRGRRQSGSFMYKLYSMILATVATGFTAIFLAALGLVPAVRTAGDDPGVHILTVWYIVIVLNLGRLYPDDGKY